MLFKRLSGQGFPNFHKQIFLKETLNYFSIHFGNASCKLWHSPSCFLVDHELFPFFPRLGWPRGSLFCLYITTWCLWELRQLLLFDFPVPNKEEPTWSRKLDITLTALANNFVGFQSSLSYVETNSVIKRDFWEHG